MACNSIATTRAQLSIMLNTAQLAQVLATITGAALDTIYQGRDYAYISKGDQMIIARIEGATIELEVSATNQAQADRIKADLDTKLPSALAVEQQRAALTRLQQLGKLSNIKTRDNGVTARLTITI